MFCRNPTLQIGHARYLGLLAVFVLTGCLMACAPAYSVRPLVDAAFDPTESVELLSEPPTRPHQILAEFRGSERGLCGEERPYCTLQDEAMSLGADAIWIQSRSVYKHYDEWIMIEGKLTKIYHPAIETISGVLIRYTD